LPEKALLHTGATPSKGGVMKKIRVLEEDNQYPCSECGKTRTKDEGGTTFTVCDECWDKYVTEDG